MSTMTNESRGTADPVDVEYLHWEPENSPFTIHIHLDAVDGMARDVIEGFKALPRRGVEVGGLLLGKVIGSDHPDVWIERYQRIDCQHRFGPQFVLDQQDHLALEEAAQRIAGSTELAVVGLYRSHTRSGFQLQQPDLELIGRYFSDPSDLVLLIRPENLQDLTAQFFAREADGAMQPIGEPFPFRGRVLGTAESVLIGDPDLDDSAEVTRQTHTEAPDLPLAAGGHTAEAAESSGPSDSEEMKPSVAEHPAPARERMRRLVPDFAPAAEPVEPGGVFSFEPRSAPAAPALFGEEPEPSRLRQIAAKWWPLAGAVVLVCAAMAVLFMQGRRPFSAENSASETSQQEYRPVGMYVDPGAQRWRISWNPAATAFHNAHSVTLFVRDGETEDRADLTRQDVQAGTYSWQPKSNDVTFRIESIDNAGRISAESFRVIRPSGNPSPAAAAGNAPAPAGANVIAAGSSEARKAPAAASHEIAAKPTHKVPPIVPASIRPRIHGAIPIDIRVHIDARGRVISASPTSKPKAGLNAYLASRALHAARQWRFTPAHEDGKPVPTTQIIHFVFEK